MSENLNDPVMLAAKAMYRFIDTEMRWCGFRAESLEFDNPQSVSEENAEKLWDFLQSLRSRFPEAMQEIER